MPQIEISFFFKEEVISQINDTTIIGEKIVSGGEGENERQRSKQIEENCSRRKKMIKYLYLVTFCQ